MVVEFVPVQSEEQIQELATMADEIWHEYWPEHIGKAQTDYMVKKFQSLDAIRDDIKNNNYEYWLIRVTDEMTPEELKDPEAAPEVTQLKHTLGHLVGYTGGHVEEGTKRFFISKIYVYKNQRGKGYASDAVRFYERLCRDRGLEKLFLTVNKGNEQAIKVYEKKGFKTIESVKTDIGEGFYMDDYIMEKDVK